jgi:hypothetical protein
MDPKIPMGKSAFLLLKPHAKRIFLVDSKEQVISARFLLQDEQVVSGSMLDFISHSILVGECVGSHATSVTEDISSLPAKLSSRSFAQVVKSSKVTSVSSLPEAPLVRWQARCSPIHDGSRSFQAFLILRPKAKRLVLLDMQEEVLDARFLLENEKVHSGLILDLKFHTVAVGERIIADSLDLGVNILKSSCTKQTSSTSDSPTSLGVPALDFSKGAAFEATCKSKFGHPITIANHSLRRAFFLVISFGRATFKLDVHTVAITLQSCFGGLASAYKVRFLRDRSFQFSVFSSAVGFEIYNQSKVCTPLFEFSSAFGAMEVQIG